MQFAVQLNPAPIFGRLMMPLSASLPLLRINNGWLKTLKTSSLSSSLADSHLGIRDALISDTSKRYNVRVGPALRTRLPLMNLKSTGSPVYASHGPLPLPPARASHVHWDCAQVHRPSALVSTP